MAFALALCMFCAYKKQYLLGAALFISFIGARLSTVENEFYYHGVCMLISFSLLMLARKDELRLIALLYIPRIIIGLISYRLYVNMQTMYLISEVFLWVQFILTILYLKNDDDGSRKLDINSAHNGHFSGVLPRRAFSPSYEHSKSHKKTRKKEKTVIKV